MSEMIKKYMKFWRAAGALDISQRVATTRATAEIPHRTFIRTLPEIAGEKGPVNRPEARFSSEIREGSRSEGSNFDALSIPESREPLLINELARIAALYPAWLGNLPTDSEGFPSCLSSLNRLN
jgi:hypothetical protein